MNTSCHTLEIIAAPVESVKAAILTWFTANGFVLGANGAEGCIQGHCGSSFGISDRQTSRVMEVIVSGDGDVTAVSIFHHTTRIAMIVGIMFGSILRDEVNSLATHLKAELSTKR